MNKWNQAAIFGTAIVATAAITTVVVANSETSQSVEAVDVGAQLVADRIDPPRDNSPFVRDIEPEASLVTVGTTPVGPQIVPGLASLEGTLSIRGDDFVLSGREADFGPEEWLVATNAPADLDADGSIDSWWTELTGVVGRTVTVLGDVDDDDVDVFEIDGVSLRPLYSVVAPWSSDWKGSNIGGGAALKLKEGLTADEASKIALDNVPGVVISARVDVNDAHPYWELDVRSADGSLYDVEIDAVTGKVIEIDRD